MAWRCRMCGKGSMAGKSVSHSHKTSNRRFLPNLRRSRVNLEGKIQTVLVCTRCLRSQRITKAGPRIVVAA